MRNRTSRSLGGKKGTIDVDIERLGSLTNAVAITASDTSGIKVKIKPPTSSTTGDRLSFTYKVKKLAPLGTDQIVFTGIDGANHTHTATLTMVVQ